MATLVAKWGFIHDAVVVKRTSRLESITTNGKSPEEWARTIAEFCKPDLEMGIRFEHFYLERDAFCVASSSGRSVAERMEPILTSKGLPVPEPLIP